jgi:glycosyltransferase involved in cell wall biosynthesis
MKIVQLIPQLSSGGAERFVVDLSNELSLRHEVSLVVSFALEGNLAFYLPEISERVKVHSLQKKLGFDIRYLYSLYKFIKQEKPDVVHTHTEAFAYFATLKWLFPKVKFVHTVHNDAQFESGGRIKTFLKKMFFKRGWCKAATISAQSAASFADYYGATVRNTLIYNGRSLNVEPSTDVLIPRTEGRYNFVSIGHISKTKNHMLMCTALTNLLKQGVVIDLYMFGRFADETIVESIKSLNNPHIHMLGERDNPMQYLGNADVFCMSSIVEGLPISLIEALACGMVPICTAVGGISDLVEEGKIGFLSHDLTVESYTKAIERFLALSADEVETMKKYCLEKSKLYSIEECTSQYEDLYKG